MEINRVPGNFKIIHFTNGLIMLADVQDTSPNVQQWTCTKCAWINIDDAGNMSTHRFGLLTELDSVITVQATSVALSYSAPAEMANEHYARSSGLILG